MVHNDGHDDDHMTALAASSSTMPTYGGTACTLVGNDERNGRVNPALEVNDDEIDLTEMKRRKARRTSNQNSSRTTTNTTNTATTTSSGATQSQTTL